MANVDGRPDPVEALAQARAQGLIPPSPDEAEYAREAAGDEGSPARAGEPFALFAEWLSAARHSEPNDPNAMALATTDADGMPDVRMVLLKDFDAEGFVFYTNALSAKGRQISANPQGALCFHWKSLRRQIRVRGPIVGVAEAEADTYFASRARLARIGAWASPQSTVMEGRFVLETRVAEAALRFGLGDIPRPPHWKGYRLRPLAIEFWRDRPFRLHERIIFTRASLAEAGIEAGPWSRAMLFP